MSVENLIRDTLADLADTTRDPAGDLAARARYAVRTRRRRRWLAGTAALLPVAAVVTGVLALLPGPVSGPEPRPAAAPPVGVRVSGLIGIWAVEGPDVPAGSVLRVDLEQMQLRLSCGDLLLGWVAAPDGQFAAAVWGKSGCQYDKPGRLPGWLLDATGFRLAGRGWTLLGDRGAVLARLVPTEPVPAPGPFLSDMTRPRLRADDRALLDRFEPVLPARVRPATREQLIGRWGPDAETGTTVTFSPGGRFRGRDRWLVDRFGRVLISQGADPAIGCLSVVPDPYGCADLAGWFGGTWVAWDNGTLALYDRKGSVVHRLIRRD